MPTQTGNFNMELVANEGDEEPRINITAWWDGEYWGASIPLKPLGLDNGANGDD